MTTIICKKFNKECSQMEKVPAYGEMGILAQENLSKEAWDTWCKLQVIMINELHLNLIEPSHYDLLLDKFKTFLEGDSIEREFLDKLESEPSWLSTSVDDDLFYEA
ncbi:Fe(2+)-trafficking protein [Vibrio breoganii]